MDPNLTGLGISTSTLLAMAAMFLGLALIVQVIQEIYKHLLSRKSSVYHKTLSDFFGPWVEQLYEPGSAARFHVRGPFQWFKSRPVGQLLPLSKEELLRIMDELPSGWMGETLKVLREAVRLEEKQAAGLGARRLSELRRSLEEEIASDGGEESKISARTHDARRMLEFLREEAWTHGEEAISAAALLERFHQRFFPDRVRADEEFEQLSRNFEYMYERHNLRYSFLFGLLVAIALNFPFDGIYRRAQALTPEQAIATAEAVQGEDEATPQSVRKLVALIDRDIPEIPVWERGVRRMAEIWRDDSRRWTELAGYFLNCLITALLVSFGAPFWNRLTDTLLSRAKRGKTIPVLEGGAS